MIFRGAITRIRDRMAGTDVRHAGVKRLDALGSDPELSRQPTRRTRSRTYTRPRTIVLHEQWSYLVDINTTTATEGVRPPRISLWSQRCPDLRGPAAYPPRIGQTEMSQCGSR